MTAHACSVGIVGGGMLGMTLALRLRRAGHHVTILEGARQTGGLASPNSIGGYTWDRFYHVILLSDRHLRELLEDLGLGDQLRWRETRTGFYTDGRLHSLSTSLEFLRFPALRLVDKLRLAATILYASRLKDSRRLEAIPVVEWLRRWSGTRTVERIWLPLLKSKLGENYRHASAAFIWAIIARMYAARRSGFKREMFGYVEGGYENVLARFRRVLADRGVVIRTGQRVQTVTNRADEAEVRLADGTMHTFHKVVLTIPASRIPGMCPQLADEEQVRLRRVVYQGIVCAAVLLKQPLADFYVTNITEAWVPFTGVIEMTALVDRSAFGGNSLVYLPRYLAQSDPFWSRSDDDVRDEFLSALGRMYPDFRRDDVLAFDVSRVREVLAVSTLHYSERALPPVRTSLEHVFIVNSAQIANGTLNNNETVALANRKAAELEPLLRHRPACAGV